MSRSRGRFIDRFEFRFIAMVMIVGFIISRRQTVEFFNSLSLLQGLLLWYVIFGVFIYLLLHGFDINIGASRINKWGSRQTVGSLLALYAFFIVTGIASDWASFGEGGTPRVLVQSEDGVFFDLYYGWLQNADVAAVLTYIVTPFVLMVISAFILAPGQMKRILSRRI